MGKGYKLTSASGDGPKQCAFFFSDQGCRNGANCKFSHEASANNKAPPPTSVSSSSVCSSESEGEIVEAKQAGAYASLVKAGDDSNPFFSATAPPPSAAAPPTPKKPKSEQQQQSTDKKKDKKRKKSDLSSPFDLGNNETQPQPPATAVISSPNVAAAPPKKSKGSASTTPKATNPSTPGNFRNLNLPIASFSLPTTTTPAIKEKPTTTSRPTTPQHEPAQPYPLPTATPLHRKWHDAVLATRSHPNYSSSFDFSKAQQLETNQGVSSNQGGSTWITSRPYGPWCASNPSAIAIDCEMCETRNPLTGMVDTKALCRLSVVNAENPEEVLLDTLVKPDWPVVDYRSWVNGIKKEDLEKVEFTLGHAQLFMGALVSDQTVIVGHAVHNDLLALKMIHHCNADTAMLYTCKDNADETNNSNSTPSLKNLAHSILQKVMPDVHDSVNDARVALSCAEHWVSKKGVVDPIEKVFTRTHSRENGRERLKNADTSMLLVHRLPQGSTAQHINDMLLAFTHVKPKNVTEVLYSGKHGKCHVEFVSREHAELAYVSLTGEEYEDKTGKKQKRVKLKNGDYVCVRKMKKN